MHGAGFLLGCCLDAYLAALVVSNVMDNADGKYVLFSNGYDFGGMNSRG